MQQLPTRALLREISRDPRSYVIFIFAGMLWYFVFKWTGATGEINSICEQEKTELRKELAIERQTNLQLILTDRQRSDSINRELTKQFDSLLREKLEIKTKENLQNDK